MTHNNSIDYPSKFITPGEQSQKQVKKDIEQSVFITVEVFLYSTFALILSPNNVSMFVQEDELPPLVQDEMNRITCMLQHEGKGKTYWYTS